MTPGLSREELARMGLPAQGQQSLTGGYPEAEVERELELAAGANVRLVPFYSPEYPALLRRSPDFPALLYLKGSLAEQDILSLAIVGSRRRGPART